jgi:hypothetical protein
MSRLTAPLVAASLCLSLCGCATIVNGTAQKIEVSSVPSGADVRVDDKASYVTPVKLRLERRSDHILLFSKEGYEGQTVKMTHVLSEWVCGNLFLGGPLGWLFDIFAGTQYKLIPNPVHVELKKQDT